MWFCVAAGTVRCVRCSFLTLYGPQLKTRVSSLTIFGWISIGNWQRGWQRQRRRHTDTSTYRRNHIKFVGSFFTKRISPTKLIELRADIDAVHLHAPPLHTARWESNNLPNFYCIFIGLESPFVAHLSLRVDEKITQFDRVKVEVDAIMCTHRPQQASHNRTNLFHPWKWLQFDAAPTQHCRSVAQWPNENKIIYSCNCNDHANVAVTRMRCEPPETSTWIASSIFFLCISDFRTRVRD